MTQGLLCVAERAASPLAGRVPCAALPVWEIAAALLPDGYTPLLLRARNGLLFAVRREG